MTAVAKDLLVYFALCALPIASFLLTGYPETQFYVSLLMVSLVVIVWFRQYYQEPHQIVDYDENLDLYGMLYVAGGLAAIILVQSLLIRSISKSLIYVPSVQLGLEFGQLIIPKFWADILFQWTLVATSEECVKLVVMLALFLWLKDRVGKTPAEIVAVGSAVGGWAFLHTFRNPDYQSQFGMVMVLGAFLAGLVMFLVMKRTKSLLASILIHSCYNCFVILIYYGYLAWM